MPLATFWGFPISLGEPQADQGVGPLHLLAGRFAVSCRRPIRLASLYRGRARGHDPHQMAHLDRMGPDILAEAVAVGELPEQGQKLRVEVQNPGLQRGLFPLWIGSL